MEERIVQRPLRTKEVSSGMVAGAPKEAIAAAIPVQQHKKRRISWPVIMFWLLGFFAISFVLLFLPKNKRFLTEDAIPSGQESRVEAFLPAGEILPSSQQEIIGRLKNEIRDTRRELRVERTQNRELQTREDDYREELYQLALAYEAELSALRQENVVKENEINDLRSGLQEAQITLEKNKLERTGTQIVGTGLQTRTGADTSTDQWVASAQKANIQGKVITVNSRYEFVIIDVGSKQGVAPGKRVAFYLRGKEFASGVIERVYPELSGVAVFDKEALMRIQEGQDVSVQEY